MLVDVYNHVYVNKVFMVVCVDKFSECYGWHEGFLSMLVTSIIKYLVAVILTNK